MMRNKMQRPEIIGEAYGEIKKIVTRYAKVNVPVLFLGQTGSGKELFASLYMSESPRAGKKQSENCAAFSGELLRSEIFGHKKGAYTGATTDRKGLIESCNGGVLFLDELNSSTIEFQSTILRVTENNSYRPLGSDKEKTDVDVLIIASASSLSSLREDLLHRFTVVPIPPLQKFDIPRITEHYFQKIGKRLNRRFLDSLMNRSFPGNVRELLKSCEKIYATHGDKIFANKNTDTKTSLNNFDYQRFENEFLTWNKYIDPIVSKYNLSDIVYRYVDAADSDMKWEKIDLMSLESAYTNEQAIGDVVPSLKEISLRDMVLLIMKLNYHGSHDNRMLTQFILKIKEMTDNGELPYLLSNLQRISGDNELYDHHEIIDMSHLLKPMHVTEAMKTFGKLYVNYHLEKNDRNVTATAKSLGMEFKTLQSRIDSLELYSK